MDFEPLCIEIRSHSESNMSNFKIGIVNQLLEKKILLLKEAILDSVTNFIRKK